MLWFFNYFKKRKEKKKSKPTEMNANEWGVVVNDDELTWSDMEEEERNNNKRKFEEEEKQKEEALEIPEKKKKQKFEIAMPKGRFGFYQLEDIIFSVHEFPIPDFLKQMEEKKLFFDMEVLESTYSHIRASLPDDEVELTREKFEVKTKKDAEKFFYHFVFLTLLFGKLDENYKSDSPEDFAVQEFLCYEIKKITEDIYSLISILMSKENKDIALIHNLTGQALLYTGAEEQMKNRRGKIYLCFKMMARKFYNNY